MLTIDFDATGRTDATFRDLVGHLPPQLDVWHAVPPEARADQLGRHDYLAWWLDWPAQVGHPVEAIFGYCAGGMFALALADELEAARGLRPAVVVFNPGMPDPQSLDRDFRALIESMPALRTTERAAVHRDTDLALARCGDDFEALTDELIALYGAACRSIFPRLGVDPATGIELVELFHSYVSYLAAARQIQPDTRWSSATTVASREHGGAGFTAHEVVFDVGRRDLLGRPEVARATSELLVVRT